MKMRDLMEAVSRLEALKIFSDNGVDASGLTGDDLKKAFRQLALQNHPDKGGDMHTMQMITAAYDVLSKSPGNDPGYKAYAAKSADAPIRNDYSDLNYFKSHIEELAREHGPVTNWTIWNFDGTFFRNSVTMKANPSVFPEMAKAMNIWEDKFFSRRAFFVSKQSEPNKVWLIWLDGQMLRKPVEMEHDSFNQNPGNDQSFVRTLPLKLDKIAAFRKARRIRK